ncbi:MAG: hypothetical protein AAFN81_17045 [Bacteroidota bacterium]
MDYLTKPRQFRSTLLRQYRTTDDSLAVFRIAYALFWLYLLGVPYLAWLSGNPDFVLIPKPFLSWLLSSPPNPLLLHVLTFTTFGALTALLLGWRTYWASGMTTVLLLITQALTFSFGKIDHTIITVLVPFLLRNTGWGNCYSLDGPVAESIPQQNGNALLELAIILGFAYWTAGVVKVFGGWLNQDLVAVYAYCTSFLARGDVFFNAYLVRYLPLQEYFLFWKSLDVLTVVFECGFLLAVWHRACLHWYIPLALLFHLAIGAMLGITFWIHGLVFLAFLPSGQEPRKATGFRNCLKPKLLVGVSIPILLWLIYFTVSAPLMPEALFSSPLQYLLGHWTARPDYYLGMLSNTVVLMIWLRRLFRHRQNPLVDAQ